MTPLTVEEIAAITGGTVMGTPAGAVTSAVIDSRAATAGSLFVALPGERVDGHDFLAAAAANGATAALVSRVVDGVEMPSVLVPDVPTALAELATQALRRLRADGEIVVIGITGSVGKTSTKDLLATMLAPLGQVVAPVASFNNEIGLPLTVLRADATTRVLVLEMGADAPGNLTFLTSIAPPDIAVELIVARAHLAGFGSIEGVAAAKAELIEGLVPGGLAVLNADDARVLAMAPLADRVLTFGTGLADVRADQVAVDTDGHATFTLITAAGSTPVRLGLAGAHHVTNALACATVASELGLSLDHIALALSCSAAISPHRMQVTDVNGIRVIDDAYNANLTSMSSALRALAAMTAHGRRSVAVLGEMRDLGADHDADHRAVGELALELAIDQIVVVGDAASPIAHAVREGGGRAHMVADVDAAEDFLRTMLAVGDVVLVKASNGAGLTRLGDALAAGLEPIA